MLTFVASSIIAVLVLLTILWYLEYYWYYGKLDSAIRGPPLRPFFGHMLELTNPTELYFTMDEYLKKMGTTAKFCGGRIFSIVTIDPEFVEFIMTSSKTINKGRVYLYLRGWLGTGLLTSSMPKWKGRRKLLTPAYHFKILEQFIDVFDKNSNILVKKLKLQGHLDRINIHPFISLCALDVISETAMGTSINAQDDEESEYVKAVKDMNRIIIERCVNLTKQIDFIYRFTNDYQVEKKALNFIHQHTLSIIKKKRDLLANNENAINDLNMDDMGIKKRIPFLDLLLVTTVDGKTLTDEDIQEEVDTFMFEGHDTVSAGISFCLYLISKHEEVQFKLLKEQREIFGDDPQRSTTLKDLQEMKYLEMVIKESLRLYPSVPAFSRVCTEDIQFKNSVIRKNTEIGILIYSMHRHPKFFENPEMFDPQRFDPEKQSTRHPFSYVPFSGGFRNCIGQKFAMLELKSVISKMIRNFEILEVPDFEVKLKSEIIFSSSNGIYINLKNRKW